jgi:hypothetical protein
MVIIFKVKSLFHHQPSFSYTHAYKHTLDFPSKKNEWIFLNGEVNRNRFSFINTNHDFREEKKLKAKQKNNKKYFFGFSHEINGRREREKEQALV